MVLGPNSLSSAALPLPMDYPIMDGPLCVYFGGPGQLLAQQGSQALKANLGMPLSPKRTDPIHPCPPAALTTSSPLLSH